MALSRRYNLPQVVTAAPWLPHYDPEVPRTLAPYAARTLVDAVAEHARAQPKTPAVYFKGARVTYGELDRLSDAAAAAFAALGVTRGDRVGLLLPNCPQFFIAQFGAWKLGAIVAPLNPIYTEHELEGPLREHGIETVVTLTRFYRRIKSVQPRTGVKRVIATNIKEFFPPLLRVLFTLLREKRDGDRITLQPGDHDFAHLLLVNRGHRPSAPPPAPRRSGGAPDERRHDRHAERRTRARTRAYTIAGTQIRAWNATVTGGDGDIIFLPLPLFHVYANVGAQSLTFLTGASVVLVPNPRDLNDLLATIKKTKPTFFNGVPTLYIALLNHPDVQRGKVDFTSIRICFSGASALLADTKTRFEALTGARIVEGYSLTEAMMACCINPVKGPNKLGSVGMPLPDVAVRIVDDDRGTRDAAAERGRRNRDQRPAADERLLESPRRNRARPARPRRAGRHDAPLAAHRRPRLYGRRRLRLHRRSEEGSDQDERIPGVAARDRGSDRVASGGRGGRRRRRARSNEGRSREGMGRAPRGPLSERSGPARVLPREARAVQSARDHRVPQRPAEDDGRESTAPIAAGGR